MAFSDVGKAFKDVSGGYVFDHKASFAGVKGPAGFAVSGTSTHKEAKGVHTFPADVKAAGKVSGVAVEAVVTDTGKLSLVLSKDGLVPGLKASASGVVLPKPAPPKLSLVYALPKAPAGGKSVLKADTVVGTTKVLASAGWASGKLLVGGEVEADVAARGLAAAVPKYTFGAQAAVGATGAGVVAVVVADQAGTLRASYTHKLSASLTAGLEAVHKLKAGTTTGTAAAAAKFAGGASAKAALTHTGVLSLLYAKDVTPGKATATLAMQLDTRDLSKAPKARRRAGVGAEEGGSDRIGQQATSKQLSLARTAPLDAPARAPDPPPSPPPFRPQVGVQFAFRV